MKSKVILILSSIILLISSIALVFAILADSDTKGPLTYNAGKLDFTVTGSLKEIDLIYPGLNLVEEEFKIINNSTIETVVRVKLEFYFNDSLVDINNYIDETISLTGFTFNSTDNFNYITLSSGSAQINLIESLTFNGNIIKSNYSNTNFKIKFIFHAKQSSHAEFTDFGGTWLS